MYTPKQLSDKLGVSKETLRRWELNGLISATKTPKGHRRYLYSDDTSALPESNPKKQGFIYARVSSSKQQDDLGRQISSLEKLYPQYTVLSDIGSGLNFQRKGLQRLLELTFQGAVSEVVVAHRDRLSRFGYELFDFIFHGQDPGTRQAVDPVFECRGVIEELWVFFGDLFLKNSALRCDVFD